MDEQQMCTITNSTGSNCGNGQIKNLETEAEKRTRKRSHLVIFTTTFINAIGFSIVLTSIWLYLQKLDPNVSKEYLGWMVAANPLGQMLLAPILGFSANKLGTNRPAFFFTVMSYIIGNMLYSILNIFGSAATYIMFIARFIVGVSAGNLTMCRSYIAASTTLEERTTATTLIMVAQLLGFIIGPALQTAIAVSFSNSSEVNATVLNCTINIFENASDIQTRSTQEDLGLEWNKFTAAGWMAALLGIINLVLFLPCIFQEHYIAEKEAKFEQKQKGDEGKEVNLPNPDYPAVISILGAFFVIMLVFVLLETIAVPMVIDMYAWTPDFALKCVGIGMVIVATLTLISAAIGSILAKRYDERSVMIVLGLVPAMLSMVIFFPMGSNSYKIQNCTAEESLTTLPMNLSISLLNLNINNTDVSFVEQLNNIKIEVSLYEELINDSTEVSVFDELSRQKRYVVDDGRFGCHEFVSEDECHLGCPQSQEWCQYTPIVEIWQMAIAAATAAIGYPVAVSILSSLYSKILGPKKLGVWMGLLTSVGSLSRILGPISVSYIYTTLGTRWTFGLLFSVLAITVLIIGMFYKRLVPMKLESGEHTEPLQA